MAFRLSPKLLTYFSDEVELRQAELPLAMLLSLFPKSEVRLKTSVTTVFLNRTDLEEFTPKTPQEADVVRDDGNFETSLVWNRVHPDEHGLNGDVPEDKVPVLVLFDDNTVVVQSYSYGFNMIADKWQHRIKAWAKLPDPFRFANDYEG